MSDDVEHVLSTINQWIADQGFSEKRTEEFLNAFVGMSAANLRGRAGELEQYPSTQRMEMPSFLQDNIATMKQQVWDLLQRISMRTWVEMQDCWRSPTCLKFMPEQKEDQVAQIERQIMWRSIVREDEETPTELKDVEDRLR